MASLTDILDEAASKLEPRFAEIRKEMAKIEDDAEKELNAITERKAEALKPLQDEEREIAEAIQRLTGSYPAGFRSAAPQRRGRRAGGRSSLAPDERKARVLEFIKASSKNGGTNARAISEEVGASPATVTKDLEELQESGQIVREGERRATRYLVA